MIARWLNPKTLKAVAKLKPIADELGLTMAQLALAWVLQNPGVASAIIGASRPDQVRDNVRASGVTLDRAVLKKIDKTLGKVVQRDPALTNVPAGRYA